MLSFQEISLFLASLMLMLSAVGCTQRRICPVETDRQNGAPNVVLIFTDDQSPDSITHMPTVNNVLAAEGVEFSTAITTTPLCCPSRASMLTGQYAHNHGVLTNRVPNGSAVVFDDSSTVATWLHDNGYRTSYIGKYLNGYEEVDPYGYIPPGWDDWQVFMEGSGTHRYYYDYTLNENGEMVDYGDKKKDYSADVMAEKAVDFIYESKDQPFFLMMGFYGPHQPYTYADRHEDMFRTDEQISARRPLNFNEEDISDKPEWMQPVEIAEVNRMDQLYQRSLRTLMAVDDAVADILEALDCIGQSDNTLIIFVSDNGVTYGEHRLVNSKNCAYEECIQIPYVVYYPGEVEGGRMLDEPVLNIDLAPTIADVAGLPIPDSVDGTSLMPLLQGGADDWRDAVLIEHWPTEEGFGGTIPYYEAIRTAEWKYVRYETGELELYDLVNDPYEMQNLAGDAQYADLMAQLGQQLDLMVQE